MTEPVFQIIPRSDALPLLQLGGNTYEIGTVLDALSGYPQMCEQIGEAEREAAVWEESARRAQTYNVQVSVREQQATNAAAEAKKRLAWMQAQLASVIEAVTVDSTLDQLLTALITIQAGPPDTRPTLIKETEVQQ